MGSVVSTSVGICAPALKGVVLRRPSESGRAPSAGENPQKVAARWRSKGQANPMTWTTDGELAWVTAVGHRAWRLSE